MEALLVEGDGPLIGDEASARDVIEAAMNEGARLIAVPVERLDPGFLQLRTGMAGLFMQKVMNYKMKLAIVGDVSGPVAESDALRDFIVECERGDDIWFVSSAQALNERLRRLQSA